MSDLGDSARWEPVYSRWWIPVTADTIKNTMAIINCLYLFAWGALFVLFGRFTLWFNCPGKWTWNPDWNLVETDGRFRLSGFNLKSVTLLFSPFTYVVKVYDKGRKPVRSVVFRRIFLCFTWQLWLLSTGSLLSLFCLCEKALTSMGFEHAVVLSWKSHYCPPRNGGEFVE